MPRPYRCPHPSGELTLPSCVPATPVDEWGARLDSGDIAKYYRDPRVLGLFEREWTAAIKRIHYRSDLINELRDV